MAVPSVDAAPQGKIVAVRKDLMDKYDIADLETWDDYMNYCLTIAEKETPESGVYALASAGNTNELWDVYRQMTDTFLALDSNYMDFIYEYTDGIPTVEDIQFVYEYEPFREYAKDMKTLADAGCWSRSALTNTISDDDAFASLQGASIAWNTSVFTYMKRAEENEGVECMAYDLTKDNLVTAEAYSEWFSTCWQEDMTAMVLRDRNHPSIIMWSVGNEVREQLVPQGWNIAKELVGLCHSLDPSRPTTQACDQVKAEPQQGYDQFMEELDIVGVNYTDRWRERTETFYDEEKREHPDWLLMGSEDGSVGGLRGDYRLNPKDGAWGRAAYHGKMLKAEKLWKFIRTRPYVLGSFMWTGIDYLGECFWPNKGSSAGVLDTCGYEKDGFHFYQSQWVKDRPLLYVCPHLNLDLEPGTVYPVIVYTNCFSVELLLGGKSYGVKCYEFPAQGMTQCYGHFDTPIAPITTNDLHLSWDVPYTGEELTVIGRDSQGNEIARQTLRRAGAPAALKVRADRESLQADGLDVVQLEIALVDADGQVVPDQDRTVWVKVQGGALLGMDNGDPGCRELYRSGKRDTYRGLAYAVVQAPRQKGTLQVEVSVQGLQPVELTSEAE